MFRELNLIISDRDPRAAEFDWFEALADAMRGVLYGGSMFNQLCDELRAEI